MTPRTFNGWIRITEVLAEFAERLALLDHLHTSPTAFEEVASLVHKRKVNQQKI